MARIPALLWTRLLALVLLALLASPAAAWAHAALQSADPAADSVNAAAPERIELMFNEPVQLLSLRLIDAAGRDHSPVTAPEVRDGHVLWPLPDRLPDGRYLVSWRVSSLDGHVIGGTFTFAVGAAAGMEALATRFYDTLIYDIEGQVLSREAFFFTLDILRGLIALSPAVVLLIALRRHAQTRMWKTCLGLFAFGLVVRSAANFLRAVLDLPLWIDWIADTPPLRAFVTFHCGCRIVERSQEAAFALVTDPVNMPRLALFAQGVDQYPDRAATLLLQAPALEGGPAVTLRGPGIRDSAVIAPAGLPEWFWNDWRLNAAQFPLGVDVFLTCGAAVIGLPRSILAEG